MSECNCSDYGWYDAGNLDIEAITATANEARAALGEE